MAEPMVYLSIIERINNEYYHLTVSEKKIADYILSNLESAAYMCLAELSCACGVAEATISRFSRRLGYKGFTDLKVAISKASVPTGPLDNPLIGEVTPSDSINDVFQKLYSRNVAAMAQTMELLSYNSILEAISILKSASRVICMGQGGSGLIATEIANLFSTVSNKFTAIVDSHFQALSAAMMEKTDVLFYISYSGATAEMQDNLRLAKANGCKVILITRFPNAPGSSLADIILQCGAKENPLQSGSVSVKIAVLYIADILFSEYTRTDLNHCLACKAKIADALADKHV